uniref:Uncharacterized protein n=1 Tax=Amphimedon queenslandica TaxID=400682 RepID=A0A1X7SXH5_AMPQE
ASTQPSVAITSSITENILEASVSIILSKTFLSPTIFSHMLSSSSSFSHELSNESINVHDTLLNVATETMNDRLTAKVPSPSPTHSTIKPTNSLISSTSTFVISSTVPLTPTTQSSASFLVGGIIVAVVCIILELSTSLKILTTSTNDDHDTNIDTLKDNPAYVTTTGSTSGSTTLQDNPAYVTTTGSTTLQDNPAYASTRNTVSVDDDTLYTYIKKINTTAINRMSTYGTEQCTERFMELPLVTYRAQRIGMNLPETYVSSNTLRVLQEYQFNCSSTNITSLILGINIREVSRSGTLYPSVQVFRPNGNDSDQYTLVAGSERTIYYSTSNVSTSGVFEYPLNPPIPVMSGDLLAVSQQGQANSAVRVYYISGITAVSQEFGYGDTSVDLTKSPDTNQLILVYPVTDGYCVNSTNSINPSFIKEKALEVQRSQSFYGQHQHIYPWIVFSCNGSVNKWILGANNRGNTAIQSELQIWRQLGPNNYNKIGSSLVNANTMIVPGRRHIWCL